MITKVPNILLLLDGSYNLTNGEWLIPAPLDKEEYSTIAGVKCPRFSEDGMNYITVANEWIMDTDGNSWDDEADKTFVCLIRPRWEPPIPDGTVEYFHFSSWQDMGGNPALNGLFSNIYLQSYKDGDIPKLAFAIMDNVTQCGYMVQIPMNGWEAEEIQTVVCRIQGIELDMWYNGVKATDKKAADPNPRLDFIPPTTDFYAGCYYFVFGGDEYILYSSQSDIHLTIIQEALPDEICEHPTRDVPGLYRGIIE